MRGSARSEDRREVAGHGEPLRDRGVALERSEERFRLLVESVVDYAIFLLDPDGHVASWNAGAERLKGYREVEILGQHYSAFYPDEARAADLPAQLLAQACDDGRVEHSGWRVRQDGSRFWANVVITALREPGGELSGFAKVTRDMTAAHLAEEARGRAVADQARAIERLEELDRWRRDFLAAVIHDLQNPVVAIRGFTELLSAGRIPEERHQELADRVLSNTRSLQEPIDNLRAYSRLNEPELQLRPEAIDLAVFVRELLADLAPVLDGRPVDAVFEGDVVVDADRHGLERVLRNLVHNVARHTAVGTSVRIGAREGDGHVAIEVEDDGGGIPEELLPRLFERFTSATDGGTGLGLSIVKRFVDLHGGQITVRSAPGVGTVFRIELPTGDRLADARAPAVPPRDPTPGDEASS
jgi:PAS domain S-box-containing protein